ncbi:MAG TPA: YceI family protein [Candidatus Dormibacteraeota bacterium]|nr:YceI family protein [Candidatus Dormibacteraeota bacterium]
MTTQTLDSAATWQIDATHSSADFAVRHMMIAKVKGTFRVTAGSVETAAGNAIPTSVQATVDAASVSTREADRDAHLRSADFFDVERFPTMEFRSTRIAKQDETHFTVTGDLTLHGVTKTVELAAEYEGGGKDPWGNQRIAYSAHAQINRKDFGLEWNAALETGGVLVGEQVEISLTIEAVK